MWTSRDETSPLGLPPGPALRLPFSQDLPIFPLLGGRPNQISTPRRGAISGKHMAQMPTPKLLFASRWVQEDSREDECFESGTACLWCFPHGGNGSGKFLSRGRISKYVKVPLVRTSHITLDSCLCEAFRLSTTLYHELLLHLWKLTI